MKLEEYREKIVKDIKEKLNVHSSYEILGKIEASIDNYSDWYKEENGMRPRADIAYFRSLFCEEAKTLLVFFYELPIERRLFYIGLL